LRESVKIVPTTQHFYINNFLVPVSGSIDWSILYFDIDQANVYDSF
jgi:hypothetical protein